MKTLTVVILSGNADIWGAQAASLFRLAACQTDCK